MSDLIPPQILHVDDDREALDDVKEYLAAEELPGWGRPAVTSLQSFDQALATLEEHRFDLIILDVRLGGHGDADAPPEEEEGVRTLDEIKQRRFLPVVFWTGLPAKVEHIESPLVRVVEKTARLPALLESVKSLFETGLPRLNRALWRLVEDEQRRYMWEFVAQHWDALREDGDEMALAYVLVRRLGRTLTGPGIQRLAAELGSSGPGAPPAGRIHATEMYIVPPLADTKPAVGELYRESDGDRRYWMLMTPSCDLQWDKAQYVVLAACHSIDDDVRVTSWRAKDDRTTRPKVRDLVSHKTGGQDDRTFFLPSAPTIPDLVVDFQQLRSIPRADLDALERLASLVSPFTEAVVNRFGRYFGRVGTDDLDVAGIMDRLQDSH